MKLLKNLLAGAALATAFGAHSAPITPTITLHSGVVHNTAALTGFSTSGDEMDGMRVTAYFKDGFSQTLSWADLVGDSGGVTGTGWSLSQAGDTFGGSWTLLSDRSSGMSRLVIDGQPGDTLFDVQSDDPRSPGSAFGLVITSVDGPSSLPVFARYVNEVQVGGIFYGDLYTTLDLSFLDASGGGDGFTGSMAWETDTDSSAVRGGVVPVPVPEPTALVLASAALLGLAAARRRRTK